MFFNIIVYWNQSFHSQESDTMILSEYIVYFSSKRHQLLFKENLHV